MGSGNSILREEGGQVFLETLMMALFLCGFFAALLAFTRDNHRKMESARWSRREGAK